MFGSKKDIFDRLMESNKNIIINGDISSGKTSNIIFPLIDRLVDNHENFLFLDAKEEYANKYYGYLKSNDYNIIIINLQEPDRSNGFNPLNYPYMLYKSGKKDKAIEYLEVFAKNIFVENNEDRSFWNLSACDLFIGLSMLLFENAGEEEVNVNSVNNLVSNVKLREYVEKIDKNSPIYSCLSGSILAPNETREGIISTFKQQLRKIVSKEKLNNLLYKTTFDIDKLSKDKNAIFIINRDDFRDSNVIAVIAVEQIFKIIFDSEINVKYNFVLDNIDTLDNINNLDDMLASGIAKNIYFTIATRSLEDFNKKYGEYINKLSNIISINNKNVEVVIDSKYEKIRYSNSIDSYPKDVINYPVIPKYEIKIFTLGVVPKKSIVSSKKKIESKDEFVNVNPFISKQDDNIFSVYEDNKVSYSNNNKEIDELINKMDHKIEELAREKDNYEEDTQLDNINKKIVELEEKSSIDLDSKDEEEYIFGDSATTDDLLKMIDDRIIELSRKEENKDNNGSKVFDHDDFPSITHVKEKKYVKNTLAHFDKKEIIESEIERELEELGFIKIIDEKKYYMNGYTNMKNKLLKEKYNIENNSSNIF